MPHILAITGSNSSQSINKALVQYTTQLIEGHNIVYTDMNDYVLPLYGIDLEKKEGIPAPIHNFLEKITHSSAIIISLAEHNGTYTTAFKNLLDWTSRVESKLWMQKPMLLMATSPGSRGGQGVLDAASVRFPIHGADVISVFSLPNFGQNFDIENSKITLEEKDIELKEKLHTFLSKI